MDALSFRKTKAYDIDLFVFLYSVSYAMII